MHEYSIVQSLIELCEENAKVYNAAKIYKVIVKIGVLSGVDPHLLKIAFDAFKEETICNDAKLIINMQPLVIQCNVCGSKSELKKIIYKCRQCGDVNVEVVDGKEMYLMRLEME